jgi:hypothetical protein
MTSLWFKAKRYGYGWYPCTWQGWVITAMTIVAIIFNASAVDATSHSVSDTLLGSALVTVILVLQLLIICALTGEKARWRWGS